MAAARHRVRVATRVARLVRVGMLPRALATQEPRGPHCISRLRRRALGLRVACGARPRSAAAREAQPAVRMLEVPARALPGKRLSDAQAEAFELIGVLFSELLEEALHLVFLVVDGARDGSPRRAAVPDETQVREVQGQRRVALAAAVAHAPAAHGLLQLALPAAGAHEEELEHGHVAQRATARLDVARRRQPRRCAQEARTELGRQDSRALVAPRLLAGSLLGQARQLHAGALAAARAAEVGPECTDAGGTGVA
mmetsp:Transcript_15203/g.49604  ORF Transcript_15203/g.49604 Transcript_15203/m.49604 type:complete len:255 (+) Transcript_15203:818-1582(+)